METKWSDYGFLGSLLLVLFSFFSLIIYFTPPSFFGTAASAVAILMAILGILASFCFSLGFLAMRDVLNAPGPWLTFFTILWTISAWIFYGASQTLLALGNLAGLILGFYSIYGLMITFLLWGLIYFTVRKQLGILGGKGHFALGAGLLFFINSLGWITLMGFGILALAALFCALIFAPGPKFSRFSFLTRIISKERMGTIRRFGPLLLVLYSLFQLKWDINAIFPIPVVPLAIVNFISIFVGWICVFGMTLVIRSYEFKFENSFLWFATLTWIPGLLLLTLTDFQWLMSNLTVFIDLAWGLALYSSINLFWVSGSLFLAVFSFLTAIGMFQIYRTPEMRGNIDLLLIHIFLLATGVLWIIGYGYLGFIIVGFFLWMNQRKIGAYE